MNDAVLEIEGLTVRSAEGDALVKNVGLCLNGRNVWELQASPAQEKQSQQKRSSIYCRRI